MQLADFGLSRILTHDTFSHVVTRTYGTMAYMPPELLKTGKLARPTDVYSFAMCMWEIYSGEVRMGNSFCVGQSLALTGQVTA
jgi:serine/threonine protein kinase